MKTKKTAIIKSGFIEAKRRFKIVSLPLSFFAVFSILALVLGFYAPITLILTIPFVVVPSFFSVAAINTVALNENAHEGIGFFIMFKAYFTQMFKGGYKIIFGLLKSFLIFIIISTVLTGILTSTLINHDPEYIKLLSITDQQELIDALNNFINTNETFNFVLKVTYMSASFGFFCMCIHHFAINSYKYNYNFLASVPLPMHDLNIISKEVQKKNRWSFLKEHYKAFWFLLLILLIGFAGGELFAFFLMPNLNVAQIPVVGLFISLILGLFFIPYFLNTSQQIFILFRPFYVDVFIDLSKKSIEEMRQAKQISEEKEKELLQIINSQDISDKTDNKDKDSK